MGPVGIKCKLLSKSHFMERSPAEPFYISEAPQWKLCRHFLWSNPLTASEQADKMCSLKRKSAFFFIYFNYVLSSNNLFSSHIVYIFTLLTFPWSSLAFAFTGSSFQHVFYLLMIMSLHTFAYQCWFGLSCRGKQRSWSWRTYALKTTPTTAALPLWEMFVGFLTAVSSSDSPIRQVLNRTAIYKQLHKMAFV